jgi:hypothetical protein
MTNIVKANFRGKDHFGFQDGNEVWVALKPIVEAMGLDWSAQFRRINRDPILSEGIAMMATPLGHGQETVCLKLDYLNGWLFTIDSVRIKDPDVRERVQVYQRECYRVLYRHFSGDREKLIREANDTMSLSLRMVTESRHIHGPKAAAQLWDERGLPKVPAMDEVWQQGDLLQLLAQMKAA